jgi:UDP-N-acetyl-D-glucosamine dehydrogenase
MSDIAVIIGVGHGGLPLAREAIRSGPRVIGVDPSQEIVVGLGGGRSNIDDATDNDIMKMKCGRFAIPSAASSWLKKKTTPCRPTWPATSRIC